MKFQSSKMIRLASTGAAGLAFVQSLHAATVLTGSGQANNAQVTTSHGSSAPGTPDIAVSWGPGGGRWDAYLSRTTPDYTPFTAWPNDPGANGVYQIDGPGTGYTGATTWSVSFTPSSSTIAVFLNSITLNDWVQGTPASTTLNWSVVGSVSGTLGSGTGVTVADGTTQQLNFGLLGLGGEIVTLNFTPTSGDGSYFAVDNLSFDQVAVPEPSGAVLAAVGLGAAALRRRRK
jgi:MYXO-CTERM domain-containing protein